MPKAMECPDMSELRKLASGELPAAAVDALAAHMETCSSCLARVQTLSPTDTFAQSLSQVRELHENQDSDVVVRLIARLKKLEKPAAASTVAFACKGCGKTLKTKSELAGKAVKCPSCQQVNVVPSTAASPAREERTMATLPPRSLAGASVSLSDRTEAGRPTTRTPRRGTSSRRRSAKDEIGRLGPYRVLEVLGRGGMGVVFRAEDSGLKRIVALKAMLPTLAASPSAKQRFLREARTAASIKHDHIVTIHQVGEDRGVPYLGHGVFARRAARCPSRSAKGKLPTSEVLRLGIAVAEGLAAAHEFGLVHRDIKPANIWLESVARRPSSVAKKDVPLPATDHGPRTTDSSRAKILDFGLARSTDDQAGLTQTGAIIGTPAYMAPEQAQGVEVDQRCDLFSLGCMLYAMTTGRLPFRGKDTISTLMAVATEEAPAPQALNSETPKELSDYILRLLAKNPNDRPATAHDVAVALTEIQTQLNDDKTENISRFEMPKTLSAPKKAGGRRRGVLLAAGAALVAAVVAGIVFLLPTSNGTVRFEINDDDIEVVLTKTGARIKGADKQHDIVIAAGEHLLKVKRGDLELDTDMFVLKKGETVTLKVEFLAGKVQVTQGERVLGQKDAPTKAIAKGTVVETEAARRHRTHGHEHGRQTAVHGLPGGVESRDFRRGDVAADLRVGRSAGAGPPPESGFADSYLLQRRRRPFPADGRPRRRHDISGFRRRSQAGATRGLAGGRQAGRRLFRGRFPHPEARRQDAPQLRQHPRQSFLLVAGRHMVGGRGRQAGPLLEREGRADRHSRRHRRLSVRRHERHPLEPRQQVPGHGRRPSSDPLARHPRKETA